MYFLDWEQFFPTLVLSTWGNPIALARFGPSGLGRRHCRRLPALPSRRPRGSAAAWPSSSSGCAPARLLFPPRFPFPPLPAPRRALALGGSGARRELGRRLLAGAGTFPRLGPYHNSESCLITENWKTSLRRPQCE